MDLTEIQIIYTSASGNTELVVEKVASILAQYHIKPTLHKAEFTGIDVIKQHNTFLFGTSTWEHGAINPYFEQLLIEMKDFDFKGKRAGFVGCGDSRYEQVLFCNGIEILKELFLQNGGMQVGSTLKINGEPHELLEGTVKEWGVMFGKELLSA